MTLEGYQIGAWLRPIACIFAGTILTFGIVSRTAAFVPGDRWTNSALGFAGAMGDPLTLTWSIVPDGTAIPGKEDSSLVAFLDTNLGAGPGESDLTQRPWFPHIEAAFNRWEALSGLDFLYEPHDDGVSHGGSSGVLGVRGDFRLAAAPIDGTSNTLAYSYYPNNSDLLLDRDDAPFFSNPSVNYRRLRDTLMHELGHGLGLEHVVSSDAAFLMEPSINVTFDGPQLDDIRGAHWFYGDALEKSAGGLGNDTFLHATDLGVISGGATVSIGTDAAPDLAVGPNDTDFVSISNQRDVDFYSFSVTQPSAINALLTPLGGTFSQGTQGGQQTAFDANSRSDLTLALYAPNGINLLAVAGDQLEGHPESLTNIALTEIGQYFVRVTGSSSIVQLYQLDVSVIAPATQLPGDYNGDGSVDAADFTVWSDSLGQTGQGLVADGNGDQNVNQADYDLWKLNFGRIAASSTTISTGSVPEPYGAALLVTGGILAAFRRRHRRRAPLPQSITDALLHLLVDPGLEFLPVHRRQLREVRP